MAQKGKTKLRDLGSKKSRKEIEKRIQKATETGEKRYYNELRLLQKAANQRIRELEKRDIKSPAYQAVQAKLEILGKKTASGKGRRFSETGKATYSELEIQKKMLRDFLNAKTSKVTGAKNYFDNVWNTAEKNLGLTEAGISREQWLDFWDNMPDKKKDRMFYSNQVKIFKAFMRKHGELIDEGKLTIADVANEIQEAETLSEVYSNLGISLLEVEAETDGSAIDDKK